MSGISAIEIFCCYARKDKEHVDELEKYLMPLKIQGLVEILSDRNIQAGQPWDPLIKQYLNTAHIILLLISADFISSSYGYDEEIKRAMERHDKGEARVIPILIRAMAFWQDCN